MKGFHVLHEACARLWRKRKDFELIATAEPAGQADEFTRFVGWVSQEELPRHYAETDITVVPTIAQEGLSRTSVEAMASGKPVVASRIGGLPYTVADGATGLVGDIRQPGQDSFSWPEVLCSGGNGVDRSGRGTDARKRRRPPRCCVQGTAEYTEPRQQGTGRCSGTAPCSRPSHRANSPEMPRTL